MAKHERNNDRVDEQARRYSDLVAQRAQSRRERVDDPDVIAGEPVELQPAPPKSAGEYMRRNAIFIAGVVAVVIVVAVGLAMVGRLTPRSSEVQQTRQLEAGYTSPYDWTKLQRDNGRFAYVVDGQEKSRLGIDVSENQHEIDWRAVAQDGIEFAMVRLGYRGATAGDLYLDEYYWANLDGAREAGLDVGVYFFSQANSVEEAIEEADYVLDYLGGVQLDYPVAFDTEESVAGLAESRTTGLSNDEMTAIAEAFCDRIEQAGYRTMVYGNAIDLSRFRYEAMQERTIWWAEYGMPIPTAKIDIALWQYSNSGEVAGVPAAVDMNIDLSVALG